MGLDALAVLTLLRLLDQVGAGAQRTLERLPVLACRPLIGIHGEPHHNGHTPYGSYFRTGVR